MLLGLARVIEHASGASRLVGRLQGGQVSGQRNLGIDDDLLITGQIDDDVGAEAPIVVGERKLLLEVAVRQHSGKFKGLAKVQLAPDATSLWIAQGLHQVAGFGVQRFLCFQ